MVTSRQRCECHSGLPTAQKYISLYFHTPLWNYPGASAPSPSRGLGRRRRGLSWAGGARYGAAWGPGPLLVSQRPLSHQSPIFAPGLSVPVPGWGGGRGTLLRINFNLWTCLLSCLLSPIPTPGEGPALAPTLFFHLLGPPHLVLADGMVGAGQPWLGRPGWL